MTIHKETLIKKAEELTPPGKTCSEEMLQNVDSFVTDLNNYMLSRKDLEELIGKNNKELMLSNHTNHFKYISSLASLYDPKTFVETIIWVIRVYMNHGFSERYWSVMLPACMEITQTGLSENNYNELVGYYEYIHSNFNSFVELSKTTPSFYEELGYLDGLTDETGF